MSLVPHWELITLSSVAVCIGQAMQTTLSPTVAAAWHFWLGQLSREGQSERQDRPWWWMVRAMSTQLSPHWLDTKQGPASPCVGLSLLQASLGQLPHGDSLGL